MAHYIFRYRLFDSAYRQEINVKTPRISEVDRFYRSVDGSQQPTDYNALHYVSAGYILATSVF